MRKRKIFYGSLIIGGLLVMSSCVDDKYDLDDIDTTTSIKLDNLTVPVRLNAISLNDVLDADDEGSIIKIMTDAQGNEYYAIEKGGEFSADPVKINELLLKDNVSVNPINVPVIGGKIENTVGPFSYYITNVDPSLISLNYFGLNNEKQMKITLDVSPSNVSLSDVVIKLPSTYVVTYNGSEFQGEVPVKIVNGQMEFPIYVKTMEFPDPIENIDNTLNIAGEIGIKYANVNSATDALTLDFNMSSFSVNIVSGSINYKIDAPEIQAVNLGDLPDFLKEGESTFILQNPQIYLNFSSLFGAYYNTSLTIEPYGVDTEIIKIPDLKFQESIVLAPNTDDLGLSVSNGQTTVLKNVPQLMNILKGTGLPESISISMDSDESYLDGMVSNLVLGTDEGVAIEGTYNFFSPLSFAAGSQIIYHRSENDFFGDDMEDVKVSYLNIQSDVTSKLPMDVVLTLYPLDKNGNRISGKNGYISASSTVAQGSSKLDLKIEEHFSGLDGIEYIVTANNMNGVSLSPSQEIFLDNIRATVSGEYVTKL